MSTIKIAPSEAKAKLSELLERAQNGETFSITLHGEEVTTSSQQKGEDSWGRFSDRQEFAARAGCCKPVRRATTFSTARRLSGSASA